MIRLVLVVLFVLVFLAIQFIPWYINLGICVALILLSKYFSGRFFLWLFMMPFKAKGKVLRGAKAQVHKVTVAGPPAPDDDPETTGSQLRKLAHQIHEGDASDDEFDDEFEDEDLDEDELAARDVPRDYYEVEVTITPQKTTGPFHHWDLSDLRLVLPGKRWDDDDDSECEVYSVNVVRDGIVIPARPLPKLDDEDGDEDEDEDFDEDFDEDDDFGGKVMGPHRVKMHVGIRKDVRELVFGYYFERFGKVELPAS